MAFKDIPNIPYTPEIIKPPTEAEIKAGEFDKKIREFKKLGMGWLKPDGTLLPCVMYRHVEAILENQEITDDLRLWLSVLPILEDQSRQDSDDFTADMEPDEHPGWHAFYSDAEERIPVERHRIMAYLYQEGWIRLGTFKKVGEKWLEAEGCPSRLKQRKEELSDIAMFLDRELLLTPLAQQTEMFSLSITHEEFIATNPDLYLNLKKDFDAHIVKMNTYIDERNKHLKRRSDFQNHSNDKIDDEILTFKWCAQLDVFSPDQLESKISDLWTWDLIMGRSKTLSSSKPHIAHLGSHNSTQLECIPPSVVQNIKDHYWVKVPSRDDLITMLEKVGANSCELGYGGLKP